LGEIVFCIFLGNTLMEYSQKNTFVIKSVQAPKRFKAYRQKEEQWDETCTAL